MMRARDLNVSDIGRVVVMPETGDNWPIVGILEGYSPRRAEIVLTIAGGDLIVALDTEITLAGQPSGRL